MVRLRNLAISVIGIAVATCLSGCGSPVDTDGVERITPSGQAWSHVTGITWSSDGHKLALTWTFDKEPSIPEGYVYTIDVENEPWILAQTRADGAFLSPAWSPTSNKIAFFSDGWYPGGIWLVDIGSQEAPTLLGEGMYCAWAPDGEQIAIADPPGADSMIYVLNTRTGEYREILQKPDEGYTRIAGISWSPTGDRLAYSFGLRDHDPTTIDTMSLYEVILSSGDSRLLVQGGFNEYPSWSPDGTMLAFSGGESRQEQTLVIVNVDDGSTICPIDIVGVGPVAWSPDGSKIAFEWKGNVYTIDTAVALEELAITEE